MRFIVTLEEARNTIIQRYPQFSNSIFVEDNSGNCNYVVKVDDNIIFRFSRGQRSLKVLQAEYLILNDLNQILPNSIRVPKFKYYNFTEDGPYVGYEMIQGQPLSKELYFSLSDTEKKQVGFLMANFLSILHNINYNKYGVEEINPIDNCISRYKDIEKYCFQSFDDELQNLTKNLFASYCNDKRMLCFTPTIIHGDLYANHILLYKNGIGIIDFGNVKVFDPSYDFGWAEWMDSELSMLILKNYTGKQDEYFNLRYKEFYKKLILYYKIAHGQKIRDFRMIKDNIILLKREFGIID